MATRVSEPEAFAPAGLNEDDVAATTMEEAERKAEDAGRTAKQRLEGAYERTTRVANSAYHEALEFAYDKPALAALVTFGAGLTLGYMLSSGRSREDYRGRVVPAVATALAEAIHEVFNGRS